MTCRFELPEAEDPPCSLDEMIAHQIIADCLHSHEWKVTLLKDEWNPDLPTEKTEEVHTT